MHSLQFAQFKGLRINFWPQAISDTEGEITKRQVQISSAGKQAEKLSKECSKTQQELEKTSADLQAKQKEQEVTHI